MAEEETTTTDETQNEESPAKKGNILGAIMWSVLGLVLGAGGFSIPYFLPGLFGSETAQAETPEIPESVEMDFVEFGEAVVNLNSDRLNRYLKIEMSFLVRKDEKEEIEELVTKQKAVLKSWLLGYLSDVSMSDIRGAAGQNQLRREIQDHFNTVLFVDGYDRIQEVLFQEFNVQ